MQDKYEDAPGIKCEKMLQMVETYSSAFRTHEPYTASPAYDTVLITGTTGGFGAHLLANLLDQPSVSRVYSVNRVNKSGSVVDRQRRILQKMGLDPSLACHPKLIPLEADTAANKNFGLESEIVEEVCMLYQ